MVNYKKSTKQLALDMINKAVGGKLRLQDVELTNIQYLEEGYYNTRATIDPTVNSQYEDSVEVEYDRVNIAAIFRGVEVVFPDLHLKKVSDYLPYLNKTYDLSLTVSDIVDGIIPDNVVAPFFIIFEMSEYNPAFFGKVRVLISNTTNSLSGLVGSHPLTGIEYPSEDKDKIQGPLYFYGRDYSPEYLTLRNYNTRRDIDTTFTDWINKRDTNVWVFDEDPQPFNLYNAYVVYNGDNDEGNEYTNKRGPEYICVIRPDTKYCTNISGDLLFHYDTYHLNNE